MYLNFKYKVISHPWISKEKVFTSYTVSYYFGGGWFECEMQSCANGQCIYSSIIVKFRLSGCGLTFCPGSG